MTAILAEYRPILALPVFGRAKRHDEHLVDRGFQTTSIRPLEFHRIRLKARIIRSAEENSEAARIAFEPPTWCSNLVLKTFFGEPCEVIFLRAPQRVAICEEGIGEPEPTDVAASLLNDLVNR